MAEKSFTEDEIGDLAEHLYDQHDVIVADVLTRDDCAGVVEVVLERLAAAGRLLPAEADRRQEWAVEWFRKPAGPVLDRDRADDRADAAHRVAEDGVGAYGGRVVTRTARWLADGSWLYSPWVEVDGSAEA